MRQLCIFAVLIYQWMLMFSGASLLTSKPSFAFFLFECMTILTLALLPRS